MFGKFRFGEIYALIKKDNTAFYFKRSATYGMSDK